MIKNKAIREMAAKALTEGRLWFRCTDQYGRSCNGGDHDFRPDPATSRRPGKWTPRINNVSMCFSGYHVTSDPLTWVGCAVSLVEVDEIVGRSNNKAVCHSFRVLDQVVPWECIDQRTWVAINRPLLQYACLEGANLRGACLEGAYLRGAYLGGAYLGRAYLGRAYLGGACLEGAYLGGACLEGAYLGGAYLGRAYLGGADLEVANLKGACLEGAYLGGANLKGACLEGAYLGGADLGGARLEGANLENWERGNDGFARRKGAKS